MGSSTEFVVGYSFTWQEFSAVFKKEWQVCSSLVKSAYFVTETEFQRYLQHPSAHCSKCWGGTGNHSCNGSEINAVVCQEFPDIESAMDDFLDFGFISDRLREHLGLEQGICADGSNGQLITFPVKFPVIKKSIIGSGRRDDSERKLLDLSRIRDVEGEADDLRSKLDALGLPNCPLTVNLVWYE